ncbi:hypothetical protein GCM10025869_17130 [Homoserinibacter gongjuensis]|uniref:PTS EIIC type-2 domain-containing protein n=1 Tax=Homoserinibacter gongjuensis TaxID=1162968 RepID=A0ABQ6JT63_9MICO|nr:hypothetical protein GCM10025869_17130 [Homoserinibacter gongjuensis]
MIMPNIAAFIAWGIITALFIQTGWVPFAPLGGFEDADGVSWPGLVGPMITYLLPLLIAYTGGRMVYNVRGGVIGAVVTMGVIIGAAGTVMFLGAMICGPLAAWILKQVDKIWAGRIRPGFEMLVDNFSSGILGFLLALGAFFGLAPVIKWFSDVLGGAVGWLVDTGLIPLASIIVEPAKVLFLNNAINHGVFTLSGRSSRSSRARACCSWWRPTPDRARACSSPSRCSAWVLRAPRRRARSSSSSSAAFTRCTSRMCSRSRCSSSR